MPPGQPPHRRPLRHPVADATVVRQVAAFPVPDHQFCVASNRSHRRIYERIAAHDPEGAAAAMFTHITEAWLVRRSGPGEPVRLQR
ncbi:FCD domain-containing protein [Solwaraspora sp. WMMD937]|uniref:FCD domain-containing protein n=1 Tax=Solwaraspora sp. WMMD937 TaxID=3016090 RepID=UPI00249AE2DC|nr:FCD domain-containing protein [Solwaraspora sp. WMMD937]WFE24691.1 FCD domain-containing protein [Solwaraspora sp. WMMD937]